MARTFKRPIKRIVIKIGTQVLVPDGQIDTAWVRQLARQIKQLYEQNIECILVTSGAVGFGLQVLQDLKPSTLPQNQALAAVGQRLLLSVYDQALHPYDIVTGQLLITREDLADRARYLNINNTLTALLQQRVLPIINENDSTSVQEMTFGDNDVLSAMVTSMLRADLLIVLSSVPGLMNLTTKTVIAEVPEINPEIEALVKPVKTKLGRGGMVTKLTAAKIVTSGGEYMAIADARAKDVLLKIVNGDEVGTLFHPATSKYASKKRWLAFSSHAKGEIRIDEGAKQALLTQGKSLLSAGVIRCSDNFASGDVVSIIYKGKIIAKGLTNYSAADLKKIKGLKTSQIKKVLGYKYYDSVVHCDNLALL